MEEPTQSQAQPHMQVPYVPVSHFTDEQRNMVVREAKVELDVRMIMSNTTYDRKEATEKLKKLGSAEEVVRAYLGVQKQDAKKLKKSVNQEIFRHIRTTLDVACEEYRRKNPVKVEEVTQHFQENEQMIAEKKSATVATAKSNADDLDLVF